MLKMSHSDKRTSPTSPKWKKPGDVMKKLYSRKKKNTLKTASTFHIERSTSLSSDKGSLKQIKNPFSKKRFNSESSCKDKKRIISTNEEIDLEGTSTFEENINHSVFQSLTGEKSEAINSSLDFVYLNEDSFIGLINEKSSDEPAEVLLHQTKIPLDWMLKSKARFMSPNSFSWCSLPKGAEEAAAISLTMHCHKCYNKHSLQTDSEFRIELEKTLIYWQHPHIPWFSLFPRFGVDCSIFPISSADNQPVLSETAQSNLYESWVIGFRSAYQLLRQDLCPFFYICSQQYTALFRSALTSPQQQISCLLTPTSMGLRTALKSQGIALTTPLRPESTQNLKQAANTDIRNNDASKLNSLNCPFPSSRPGDLFSNENSNQDKATVLRMDQNVALESDDESQEFDSEEELSWHDISSSLSFKKSKTIVTATTEDGLPSTAVLIEGLLNTQILFNFLLNCRSSIATSGKQTGMPPTILSPVVFNGASLRKLDYHAGIARVRTDPISKKSSENVQPFTGKHFTLDVSGPLMPHHINGLLTLLDNTQTNSEYVSSFSSYAYTSPFNSTYRLDATSNLSLPCTVKDEQLHFLQRFFEKFNLTIPFTAIRKINALRMAYTWKS